MYGHLLLTIDQKKADIDTTEVMNGSETRNRRVAVEPLVASNELLRRFTVANNLNGDGHIMLMEDGSLRVRAGLVIDPFTNTFEAEKSHEAIPVSGVTLVCWVSSHLPVGNDCRLKCGPWKKVNNYDHLAGLIVNDPSDRDPNRIAITVYGNTIKAVREAFFDIMTGKIVPEEPWAI